MKTQIQQSGIIDKATFTRDFFNMAFKFMHVLIVEKSRTRYLTHFQFKGQSTRPAAPIRVFAVAQVSPDEIPQPSLNQAEVEAYVAATNGNEPIAFDSIENHALACDLQFFKEKIKSCLDQDDEFENLPELSDQTTYKSNYNTMYNLLRKPI